MKKRQEQLEPAVIELANKAQHRLHRRYASLSARGKPNQKVATAVARELLGFVWAIAVHIEQQQQQQSKPARLAA